MEILGINNLWLFIVSGFILNVLPGPDSIYIIGRSASQGFRAGSVAALGIGSGTVVHVLMAAFGCQLCWLHQPWHLAWSK